MHRHETEVEKEVKFYAANQVCEHQCIGLIGLCCETILCLLVAPSVEQKLNPRE
jgi:hypothetical protein